MIEIDLDKINKNELATILIEKDKEIERLNNIIKEAIEYLDNTPRIINSIHYRDKESNYVFIENEIKKELLKILDKGSDKE